MREFFFARIVYLALIPVDRLCSVLVPEGLGARSSVVDEDTGMISEPPPPSSFPPSFRRGGRLFRGMNTCKTFFDIFFSFSPLIPKVWLVLLQQGGKWQKMAKLGCSRSV